MTAIACHICLAVSHTGAGVCKYKTIDMQTINMYAYCAYELQN